ncbi:ABC transporter substrate-binding protein [Microbacterium suaedae]|uniref:ABC transporter substrate-binding protein n=2 Tax=Microbacterium suaedae TaxID=2067813 RepID=UPI000DA1B500|nr:ABC transporter substrate-binding protein [Microbacterium suaedae]
MTLDEGNTMKLLGKTALGVAVVGAVALTGCTPSEPEADAAQLDSAEALKQAPALAAQAEAGELPALADRMPTVDDIMVEPVVEQIGEYGGTWNMPWTGPDSPWGIEKITEEALFRFDENGGVEPNVAKGYEVNDDSTEFTIHLREGMKWSDGVDFTADDVLFWWESVMKPEIFQRSVYDAFYSTNPETGERTMAEVAKVDDYTFTVSFADPRVMFLDRLAIDAKWMYAPKHYLETVLDEFIGEEAALEIAEDHGFSDLESWYEQIAYYSWIYPERPSLRPWVAQDDRNADRITWERNPYYWKADAEGNQLPYIDEIVLETVQDDSHILLETMSGHYDITQFGFQDFTTLKENEAAGGYRVLQWESADWYSNGLQINQTATNPELREVFQDARFREALSVAVDRSELSEILTLGLGEPRQASIGENGTFFQDGWAEQWAEYDTDRANELLDEIGMELDGKWRTLPNGDPFVFEILQQSDAAQAGEFEELLKHYFEAVGIRTDIQLVDRGTLDSKLLANEHMATTAFPVGGIAPSLRPDTAVPLRSVSTGAWYSQWGCEYEATCEPEVEVAPTEPIQEMWDLWADLSSATERAEVDEYAEKIVELHAENQWVIGYTGPTPTLFAVSDDVYNVPDGLILSDEYRELGYAHPAQFAFHGGA